MTSAPPIAFVNARLIDPVQETETRGGLIVIDGVIAGVGPPYRWIYYFLEFNPSC